MKHSVTPRETYQSLALLSSIVLLLNMISCGCLNPRIYDDGQYGNLQMQVSPTYLVGDTMKITKITITPTTSQGAVDLKKYKIRVNFTEEGGTSDAGSNISIANGKVVETISGELLESLAHFSSTSTLQPHGTPLQITLTLIPDVGVTSMDVDIQLLGAHNQVLQTHIVNWIHKEPPAVQFSKLEYDPVSHKIIYAIKNNGQGTTRGLQLRYTNVSGYAAGKTVLLDNNQDGIIDIGDIAGGDSSGDQNLAIDFKSATKAKFRFEVLHEGIPIEGITREQNFTNEQSFSAEALQALFSAIEDKNVAEVEQLLAKGNIDLNGTDDNDPPKTLLQKALFFTHSDLDPNKETEKIVQALIAHGADLNKIDKKVGEPVWYSVLYGNNSEAMLMSLLQAGVDINEQDSGGSTALHWVVRCNKVGFAEILEGYSGIRG